MCLLCTKHYGHSNKGTDLYTHCPWSCTLIIQNQNLGITNTHLDSYNITEQLPMRSEPPKSLRPPHCLTSFHSPLSKYFLDSPFSQAFPSTLSGAGLCQSVFNVSLTIGSCLLKPVSPFPRKSSFVPLLFVSFLCHPNFSKGESILDV